MRRRIVLTGLGVVTPIGIGIINFWESCLNGRSGVAKIQSFNADSHSTKIAAEVKDDELFSYLPNPKDRSLDRFSQLALVAMEEALTTAKLSFKKEGENEFGVYIGSSLGGMKAAEKYITILHTKGPRKVHPSFIKTFMINAPSGEIAIRYNLTGPNLGFSSVFSSGTCAIIQAYNTMQIYDEPKIIFAGGTDAPILPLVYESFSTLGVMSKRNDEPEKASRPFDKDRDGFVLGEGAGIVVLEDLEHALKRGAQILAEIVGVGTMYNIHHLHQNARVEAMVKTMNLALKDASLSPSDVDYINAHGTSTQANDFEETEAIKKAFGDHAYKLAISATKSMLGHTIGAAGAIELIVCALAIENGIIPPTINYENPDPKCDLDYVPNIPREKEVNVALSNSFGFGGNNTTIVVRRYKS